MNFTVSENFKGSCVLNTLKKALRKGMSISIYGIDLYAPDVKMAIKQGVLIPTDKEYDEEKASLSREAVVVNKTDRVLVLENLILKPWASRMVDKAVLRSSVIISAEKNGYINIISDEVRSEIKTPKKTKKKVVKKKVVKKQVEEEEVESPDYSPSETGADRHVKPTVWNFRDQSEEDAVVVPKTPDMIEVDKKEAEEVDFVDEKLETIEVSPAEEAKKAKKKTVAKKAKKKTTQKKVAKKVIKKKGKATKKKNIKTIEPVGDKKIPKTQMDAIVELDSRGNPINKASDTLQHLIDSLSGPEDISFVDEEQAQERYGKRDTE